MNNTAETTVFNFDLDTYIEIFLKKQKSSV